MFRSTSLVYLLLIPLVSSAWIPNEDEQLALVKPSPVKIRPRWTKVPVTLGVMSRCPDAIHCENVMDTVFNEVGFEKVDVTLSFIGKLNSTAPKYGVTCMHGEIECEGNLQELCMTNHVSEVRNWWPWLECVNLAGRERIGHLGTAVDCAIMTGIDWIEDGVRACVKGKEGESEPEGVRLLQESVKKTADLGITTSCTILISGKKRCVRDDGEWKDCEGGSSAADLERSINEEWQRLNPEFA
ncbi:hypothetical protein FRC00_009335 [Tulasnella sp. 408]|nr:hypothetical protein FRC00_009335 [Tulasnella sp. 408]